MSTVKPLGGLIKIGFPAPNNVNAGPLVIEAGNVNVGVETLGAKQNDADV